MDLSGIFMKFLCFLIVWKAKKAYIIHRYLVFSSFTMDIYGFLQHFYETFYVFELFEKQKAYSIHRYLVFTSFTMDIYGFLRHFYETFYVFELFEKQKQTSTILFNYFYRHFLASCEFCLKEKCLSLICQKTYCFLSLILLNWWNFLQ